MPLGSLCAVNDGIFLPLGLGEEMYDTTQQLGIPFLAVLRAAGCNPDARYRPAIVTPQSTRSGLESYDSHALKSFSRWSGPAGTETDARVEFLRASAGGR